MDKRWLILIPVGVLALVILTEEKEEKPSNPSEGKEGYYLAYNKDEVFKGMLAVESHFRNLEEGEDDVEGYYQCCVKHASDIEGHLDEAISHALVVEGKDSSQRYRKLRNKTRNFRRKLQTGSVTPEEGIKQVRTLRREFESFNPAFDISQCEACQIHVEVIKPPQPQ